MERSAYSSLLDGLDVLQRNTLTSLKQEFVACSIIGTHKNLTAQDFIRLGNLSCLADPVDLLVYRNSEAFRVIQDSVMNCTRSGLSMPSQLGSSLLLNSSELQAPSSLSADRLTELAPLLPSLGVTFLQGLTASQLHAVLPAVSSTSFTSEQASVIVEKLFSSNTLLPVQLQKLGSLIVGVKTETLMGLTSDILLSSPKAIAQYTEGLPYKRGLCPPVANAITTKLWGFPEVVNWLDDVEPLLSCTPLLSVLPRTRLLVDKLSNTSTKQWNTQQSQGYRHFQKAS
ncbi:stereocilin-like [Xenentodon cancila]